MGVEPQQKGWEQTHLPRGLTMATSPARTDVAQLRSGLVGTWHFSRTLHRLWGTSRIIVGTFTFREDGTYAFVMGRGGEVWARETGRYDVARQHAGLPSLVLLPTATAATDAHRQVLDETNLLAVSRRTLAVGMSSDDEATLYPCSDCVSDYTELRRRSARTAQRW
jgi:hypothetical protein